jgi:hypothetical protein
MIAACTCSTSSSTSRANSDAHHRTSTPRMRARRATRARVRALARSLARSRHVTRTLGAPRSRSCRRMRARAAHVCSPCARVLTVCVVVCAWWCVHVGSTRPSFATTDGLVSHFDKKLFSKEDITEKRDKLHRYTHRRERERLNALPHQHGRSPARVADVCAVLLPTGALPRSPRRLVRTSIPTTTMTTTTTREQHAACHEPCAACHEPCAACSSCHWLRRTRCALSFHVGETVWCRHMSHRASAGCCVAVHCPVII